jgi:hypothetical protein
MLIPHEDILKILGYKTFEEIEIFKKKYLIYIFMWFQ